MRLVFPTVTPMGFGNNVITLAKAHLIAEACQMEYLPPAWPPCPHVKPPSPDGYGHYLKSTTLEKLKWQFVQYQFRAQRRLGLELWPTLIFDRADYRETGRTDVGEACLEYLRRRGLEDPKRSVVVTTPGMWGQYAGIRGARSWIGELLESHEKTLRRFEAAQAEAKGRFRVTVQIRMGDFVAREQAGTIVGGERVVRLPLDWYSRICRQLREVCDPVFVLVTDGTRQELKPFLEEFRPIHFIGQPYNDFLGVLLMRDAELVVGSNSTYTRLGVFLNDKPYIWCGETLYLDPTGRFGYLWNEPENRPVPTADRASREAVRRCFALSANFGELPGGLLRYAESGGRAGVEIADDLLYHEPVYLLD